jgi:hypothetical protein
MSSYRVAKNTTLTRRKQRFNSGVIIPDGVIPKNELEVFLDCGMIEKIETVKHEAETKIRDRK